METKVNLTLVGSFALALGLALVATTLWLASGGLWQKKFDVYLAVEEESVTGLNVNAPVSEQTERAPSSLLFRHPAVKPGPGETAPEESRP